MCSTCGCGDSDVRVTTPGAATTDGHGHGEHSHDAEHGHGERSHDHVHPEPDDELRTHTLELEVAVLAKNDGLAARNRVWLAERGITALNLMSSPGAGKTTLLERTIAATHRAVSVIEGDQETLFDAERIRAAGARAVQVNTGAGCHLDAMMVSRALEQLRPEPKSIVFIENVGNLVCPALFDLGELRKVVVISVTEGDDKPLKYPHMFAAADLVVINKTDLLPYVDFDIERLTADARKLNPDVQLVPVSAKTGDNLEAWLAWLT
ncbi:hydrogenase nickel incorporation protein HypB [Nocardioides sp.]|uniref:hydrogenase nickel incorporation protein HypB n=1 Tax=Nocardioides sp. TaxID=35761 RepID=UPI002BF02502|nr:hydrogenase nickel incorporation protein HypB [Nocardioides sp.]HXH77585.1 hydrogenase nickel incorporation protein HypB [Nocardioides sp.]